MKLTCYLLILIFISCNSKTTPNFHKHHSDSLNLIAQHLLQEKKWDSAKYFVDQALFWDSTNFGAYNNRAVANFKLNGESEQIAADFEKAIKLNPGYEISLFSLAVYYNEIKDFKKVIEACNRYEFQRNWDDTAHMREINELKLKALNYEKVIGNVTINQAINFFDSINNIIDRTHPTQQHFIDTLGQSMRNILTGKTSPVNVRYLQKCLDSAIIMNNWEFKSINLVNEIDSSIAYKNAVIKSISVFKIAYNQDFPKFIYCLSIAERGVLKNCLASLNMKLKKIYAAETDFKNAKANFKKKYSIN